VIAEIALPVAGLMSDQPYETVRETLIPLRKAAKSLGGTLDEPFLQLAFLPLPVIPHLKISDRGMIDVDAFEIIDPYWPGQKDGSTSRAQNASSPEHHGAALMARRKSRQPQDLGNLKVRRRRPLDGCD
jgi:hypothetical protein